MKPHLPPRRVVPRWRDSAAQLSEPESLPVNRTADSAHFAPDFWMKLAQEKLEEWKKEPSIGIAADALGLAVFPETRSVLSPIALAVRESGQSVSGPIARLVGRVLGEPEQVDLVPDDSKLAIGFLRRRLRTSYENPIVLVDFARHQLALGNDEAAERAIRGAISLAPDSRFVLRSATRFYVHRGQPDKALGLIRRSSRSASDPWLVSCDIVVSSVAGQAPQNMRVARQLLSAGSIPLEHLTELASAVGTLELEAGRAKEARRLFNQALQRPNDNTVSQVQWAASEAGLPFQAKDEWLEGQRFHELRCLHAHQLGRFDDVARFAAPWHADEPFSSRPMTLSSFVNCAMGKFADAERDAKLGLMSNSADTSLLNNLLYASASQSKYEEANELLRKIVQLEGQRLSPHTIANVGCLLIRSGNVEAGIDAYRTAIANGRSIDFEAIGLACLARELYIQQAPQWKAVMAECEQFLAKKVEAGASLILRTIDPSVEVPTRKLESAFKAGKWVYDKARNLVILSPNRHI